MCCVIGEDQDQDQIAYDKLVQIFPRDRNLSFSDMDNIAVVVVTYASQHDHLTILSIEQKQAWSKVELKK